MLPQRNKPTLAVATIDAGETLPAVYNDTQPSNKTAMQAKMDSINTLLSVAYTKASQLDLTEDEISRLTEDFDDSEFYRGANGNPDLIYINHASLRIRLNRVIGVGKWNMIIRRSWMEEFLTAKKEEATRVYVEAVLIVRGCYVAEAIGEGTYYKNNQSGNFGDSYEIAKSVALRRVCKELGIGLQAWSKDFAENWKNKYKGFTRPESKK
jgi:hypothetical protein